jgi:hypothetical protein
MMKKSKRMTAVILVLITTLVEMTLTVDKLTVNQA